jgi:hypothetical protein
MNAHDDGSCHSRVHTLRMLGSYSIYLKTFSRIRMFLYEHYHEWQDRFIARSASEGILSAPRHPTSVPALNIYAKFFEVYSSGPFVEVSYKTIHGPVKKICRTLSNIRGNCCTTRQAAGILAINSSCVSTGVSYTKDLMCPHRKKCREVMSGDRGGQGTGLPLPTV